jgi:hypothetical protein
MKSTWYVHLFRRWTGKRWTPAVQVDDVHPRHAGLGTSEIACYAVTGALKGEALAVALEWLATGRPAAMSVEAVVL